MKFMNYKRFLATALPFALLMATTPLKADPLGGGLLITFGVMGTGYEVGRTSVVPDPDLEAKNTEVKAAWADNENGYHFDTTLFDVQQSEGRLVLK